MTEINEQYRRSAENIIHAGGCLAILCKYCPLSKNGRHCNPGNVLVNTQTVERAKNWLAQNTETLKIQNTMKPTKAIQDTILQITREADGAVFNVGDEVLCDNKKATINNIRSFQDGSSTIHFRTGAVCDLMEESEDTESGYMIEPITPVKQEVYMIFVPGRTSPAHQHKTKDLAKKELARILSQSSATEGFILKAVEKQSKQTTFKTQEL